MGFQPEKNQMNSPFYQAAWVRDEFTFHSSFDEERKKINSGCYGWLMFKKILGIFFALISFVQVSFASSINWSSPPVTISSTGVNASDPQVVIDTTGNVIAVWNEGGLIKYSVAPVNMSFGAGATIPSSGTGNSSPRIGVDGSGNVTAVWLDSTNVLKSAKLASGGSWGSITSVSASGASSPALAVDTTGNAVAVWARLGFIETSTILFGGSWGGVTMLTATNVANHPSVAIGANGTVCAAWHSVVAGQDQIQASTQLIGGAWGAVKTVVANAFNHDLPKVAVDSNGNASMIWYRYTLANGNYTNLFVLFSTLPLNATTWSAGIATSPTPGQGNPANLKANLGYDNNGNIVALYSISYDGATFNVEPVVKQNGATASIPNPIVLSNAFAFQSDLNVNNSLGDALAVFNFFDGMNIIIQSSESNIATIPQNLNNWSVPINLSTGMNNSFPRCAHSITGSTMNAVAVWISNDGMNNLINAVTGSKSLLAPPSSVIVTQMSQNYGGFTDYFNTVSWTASPDPNLSAYGIFRNGVFVQAIDASFTSFVDHNQIQGGPVTYSIAVIDTSGDQSVFVSGSFP